MGAKDSGGGEVARRQTVLEGGVRVVSERLGGMRSCAVGFFVAAGSIYEAPAEAGISHLLEHLLFRGTANYSSAEVDQLFDELGSTANAETDKEYMLLSCRVLDTHLARAVPLMAEMVFAPTLQEVDAERAVILQELASYEDEPQELVFDRFATALFGDHPLGRPVIGSRETLRGLDREAVLRYHRRTYLPQRLVVAAAGAVDHDRLVELLAGELERLGVGDRREGPAAPPPPPLRRPVARFLTKPTEQYHLCIGAPGLTRDDPRRFALRVLEVILGATPSSRLFQEVRERRGLAYSVYTFSALYQTAGEVGVYLATGGEQLAEAVRVVVEELTRLASEPPEAAELARAKECAKSATVLALESSAARMGRLGSATLFGTKLLSLDEIIAALERVEATEVQRLAGELLDPRRLSVAAIGPQRKHLLAALVPLAAAGARLEELSSSAG